MEQLIIWFGRKLLVTTAADRHECQWPEWWDAADIIVYMDERGARVLKGAIP